MYIKGKRLKIPVTFLDHRSAARLLKKRGDILGHQGHEKVHKGKLEMYFIIKHSDT